MSVLSPVPVSVLKDRYNQSGLAMVSLIYFVLIATIYISAAIIILVVNSLAATSTAQGTAVSRLAEGAFEDTLLRLLRDPTYTGGTFNLDEGSANVTITGDGTKTVDVELTRGSYVRKFQGVVQHVQLEMSILSWGEVF